MRSDPASRQQQFPADDSRPRPRFSEKVRRAAQSRRGAEPSLLMVCLFSGTKVLGIRSREPPFHRSVASACRCVVRVHRHCFEHFRWGFL